MRFEELKTSGTWLIEPQRAEDRRGFFTRRFCRWELERRSLDPVLVRCRIAVWPLASSVRGPLLWPLESDAAELLRCAAGAVRLVVTDMRGSVRPTTERASDEIELSVENRKSVYVPAGVAYSYTTLVDNTEVMVQCSELGEPVPIAPDGR